MLPVELPMPEMEIEIIQPRNDKRQSLDKSNDPSDAFPYQSISRVPWIITLPLLEPTSSLLAHHLDPFLRSIIKFPNPPVKGSNIAVRTQTTDDGLGFIA